MTLEILGVPIQSSVLNAARRLVPGRSKRSKIDAAIALARQYSAENAWAAAASQYSSVLEIDDTLAPIWVQLGHMHKEAGATTNAVHAYRQATQLQPDAAETYLHLGHLLKNSGSPREAAEAFIGCLKADREMHDAYDQLLHLGWSRQEILSATPMQTKGTTDQEHETDPSVLPASLAFDFVHQMTSAGKRSRAKRCRDQRGI